MRTVLRNCTHPIKRYFFLVSVQLVMYKAAHLFNWLAFKYWVVFSVAVTDTTYQKCTQDPCKTWGSRGFHISVCYNSNHMTWAGLYTYKIDSVVSMTHGFDVLCGLWEAYSKSCLWQKNTSNVFYILFYITPQSIEHPSVLTSWMSSPSRKRTGFRVSRWSIRNVLGSLRARTIHLKIRDTDGCMDVCMRDVCYIVA